MVTGIKTADTLASAVTNLQKGRELFVTHAKQLPRPASKNEERAVRWSESRDNESWSQPFDRLKHSNPT